MNFLKNDWCFFLLVDLFSWEEKIYVDLDDEVNDIDEFFFFEEKEGYEMFKDGVFIIGCVGKYMIFMYFVRYYYRYIISFF